MAMMFSRSLALLLASSVLASNYIISVAANIQCSNTSQCQEAIGEWSFCQPETKICSTNQFASGCLRRFQDTHPSQISTNVKPKLRTCNSDDPPEAAALGVCIESPLDYMELRLSGRDWESVTMQSWVLQIVMSELLGVPTTIENFAADKTVNFYDPNNRLEWNTYDSNNQDLKNSHRLGDCRLANKDMDAYEPCAHVLTENWQPEAPWTKEMIQEGILEPNQGLGLMGLESWYIPRFTAERDPTLMGYFGLTGEQNRKKLANTFLRPTTWNQYCEEVSPDGCQEPDGVALRSPETSEENEVMFAEGLYTGHFRNTTKNDCTNNPNCTGHMADYPCGWVSYTPQQAYHLGIALDPFEMGEAGYTYGQLRQIWMAANATKSDVIMYWWQPESLVDQFQGTEAEFVPVMLPAPTSECMANRAPPETRCSNDLQVRVGDPQGSCAQPVLPLAKSRSTGFYAANHDGSIQPGRQSPATEVIDLFSLTNLQLQDMNQYWSNHPDNPRDAVCQWVNDNFDDYITHLIPRTFPRSIEQNDERGLMYTSVSLGGFACLLVVAAAYGVYHNRKTRVMIVAQVEFLAILLVGLMLTTLGATVTALPPSDGLCVASVWLFSLGFTLELVPLIVKVAAIAKLAQAAAKMRRVVLKRRRLLLIALGLSGVVAIFCVLWTVVDPPREQAEYEITDKLNEQGDTIVVQSFYCSSESWVWRYLAMGWNTLLLISATVLAVQTRNMRQDFNESQTLAFMIYSHTVFLVLRLITFLPMVADDFIESKLTYGRSIIFSVDSIVTICVYFAPKFWAAKTSHLNIDSDRTRSTQVRKDSFVFPNSVEMENSNSHLSANSGFCEAILSGNEAIPMCGVCCSQYIVYTRLDSSTRNSKSGPGTIAGTKSSREVMNMSRPQLIDPGRQDDEEDAMGAWQMGGEENQAESTTAYEGEVASTEGYTGPDGSREFNA